MIGSPDDLVKTKHESMYDTGYMPHLTVIWRDDAFSGSFCVFDGIEDYVSMRNYRNVRTN